MQTQALNLFLSWRRGMNMKATVFQPRLLQLNLDNINQLLHSKYPNRKNWGICQRGNRTHDLLRAWQTPKPLDHRLPWINRSENDVLMDMLGGHGEHYNTTIHSTWTLEQDINYLMLNHVPSIWVQLSRKWDHASCTRTYREGVLKLVLVQTSW